MTAGAISVTNEVMVPLVLVSKYGVLNVYEYVTNMLNAPVSDNSLTAATVSFATQLGVRRLKERGDGGLRRLGAGGMSSARAESVYRYVLAEACAQRPPDVRAIA